MKGKWFYRLSNWFVSYICTSSKVQQKACRFGKVYWDTKNQRLVMVNENLGFQHWKTNYFFNVKKLQIRRKTQKADENLFCIVSVPLLSEHFITSPQDELFTFWHLKCICWIISGIRRNCLGQLLIYLHLVFSIELYFTEFSLLWGHQ